MGYECADVHGWELNTGLINVMNNRTVARETEYFCWIIFVINFCLGGSDFPLLNVCSVHCILLICTEDSSFLEYVTGQVIPDILEDCSVVPSEC